MGLENGTANGHLDPKNIETRLLINGKLQEAEGGATFPLTSPYSRETIAHVSEASEADTNAAVAAAKAAFPAWSALGVQERAVYLKKFAALIAEHNDELAQLEAMSMGKPIAQFGDAMRASKVLEAMAEISWTSHGKTSLNTAGFVNMTFRQPYGVVAAIIPWNVPTYFFCNKAAAALAAGNTVVVKSSEKAPLTSAKLAQLSVEAGFPPGVLNVLSGHGTPSGACLSTHMDVRALSFTGSGRTGRLIQAAAAKSNLKSVILELGGKSPAVVFEDADLEKAAAELQFSMRAMSGQICMASSRVYVQESIADKFIEAYKKLFGRTNMGDPREKGTDFGPQADETQYKIVHDYIRSGKESGKLILGGEEEEANKEGAFFVQPTIFTDTPEDAKIMKNEVFGSVVNINTFKTEEEALAKANDTEYGLYASVYTKDIDRALKFAKGFEAGYVGVNCTSPTVIRDMPMGGYKASGQGREGLSESIDHYLETKAVIIKMG